jgi:putative DNA primase/helicase
MASVRYDPKATCPRWKTFLDEIFSGDQEMMQFLQRAVGYSLTGQIGEQCLFFAYGTGANGKSVVFNTLERLLGEYAYRAPAEMILQQKQTQIPADVAQLKGKRFVITSELEDNRRLAEARVKSLTGGDTIEARELYGKWFSFKPTHKLWMFGNHKPVITGADEGIWRRVRVIPFTVTIPEEKRRPLDEFVDYLCEEGSGILNWALEGYIRYREAGLNAPDRMREATKQYRTEMDVVGQFIDEYCERLSGLSITAKSLWQVYHGWCDDMGERSFSGRRFCQVLRERGLEVRNGTDNKVFVYGLALKLNMSAN